MNNTNYEFMIDLIKQLISWSDANESIIRKNSLLLIYKILKKIPSDYDFEYEQILFILVTILGIFWKMSF